MESERDARRSIFLEERRVPLFRRGRALLRIAGVAVIGCLTLGAVVKLYLDRRPSTVHRQPDRLAATAMVAVTPSSAVAIVRAPHPGETAAAEAPPPTPSEPASDMRPATAVVPEARSGPRAALHARVASAPSSALSRQSREPADDPPIAPYHNGTKAVHLTGEALRLALIEDRAITQRANEAALTSPPADRQ